jgi:hypothetical protein
MSQPHVAKGRKYENNVCLVFHFYSPLTRRQLEFCPPPYDALYTYRGISEVISKGKNNALTKSNHKNIYQSMIKTNIIMIET